MSFLQQGLQVSGSTENDRRFRLFLVFFVPFLVLLPLVLLEFGRFTLRAYVLASFVWLLVTSEVFAPTDGTPTWWTRLRGIRAVGWLVAVWILFQRVMAVL